MIDAQLPGQWKENTVSITAANTTQAKILCDVAPAGLMAAISGETALPGEAAARQRIVTGGQRVIDGDWTSTDSVAKSGRLWVASQLSLYANMGTVATTATTNGTFTRSAGSFITDGWQVGDSATVFGSATAGNNGVLVQLTTVVAGTITFNGTPLAANTEGAGFRLVRVSLRYQKAIAITAGSIDGTPPVPLFGGTQDPGSLPPPDTGLSLGPNGMLLASLAATASALPARIDVHALVALY